MYYNTSTVLIEMESYTGPAGESPRAACFRAWWARLALTGDAAGRGGFGKGAVLQGSSLLFAGDKQFPFREARMPRGGFSLQLLGWR
jgi:hypothetical protein